MDPRPTTPTSELDQESPQEKLDREQRPADQDSQLESRSRLLAALAETGALRADELTKRIEFAGDPAEWKRLLWWLHNEGYLKVRWVGLADPDPVEVRLTDRGRAWLVERNARNAASEDSLPGRGPDAVAQDVAPVGKGKGNEM